MKACLLLGPSGSGKTPLGWELERSGIDGAPAFHFDFGQQLRDLAAERIDCAALAAGDKLHVRRVLEEGLLLENETFYIAAALLQSFIDRHAGREDAWIVLNGLPRHVGQARNVDRMLAVRRVLLLDCPPEKAWERIRANTGGDRVRRADDDLSSVRTRHARYRERTKPMVDFYQAQSVPIIRVPVAAATQPPTSPDA